MKTVICVILLIITTLVCGTEDKPEHPLNVEEHSADVTLTGPKFKPPTNDSLKKSRQDELDILPEAYYSEVAPMVDGKPVKVIVSLIVLNIKLSQGSSQTFDADIFLHNYWTDQRLQKPTNEDAIAQRITFAENETIPQYKLNAGWKRKLWIPDIHIRNAISGGISNIITPTQYFYVTNYTDVFMAVRLNLKLSCEMNFAKFPFDTQKCFINVTTTSDDVNTVMLEWDSFRVGSHMDVSEFHVIGIDQKACIKHHDIGTFSCLYGEIHFKRNTGNYFIKRFIPSFIIVVLTFIGYWIPTGMGPARTSLQITALLALITQQIDSDLNVSYIYALQVWTLVCIFFVFANLTAFAFALTDMHLSQKRKKNKQARLVKKMDGEMQIEMPETRKDECGSKDSRHIYAKLGQYCRQHFHTTTRHSRIDYISRVFFPTSFLIFVIAFAIYVY